MENITLGGKTREVTDEQLEKIEKLLGSEQPKLRHGDYGYLSDGDPTPERVFVANEGGKLKHICHKSVHSAPPFEKAYYNIIGNIFSDLEQYATDAANVKTVCRYTHPQKDYNYATANLNVDGRIDLIGGILYPDCAIKHAHAIIQVALTAKRKAK